MGVRIRNGVRNSNDDSQRLSESESRHLGQSLSNALSFQVLGDQEGFSANVSVDEGQFSACQDAHNAGMGQAREEARFAMEALTHRWSQHEVPMQDFDGAVTIQSKLCCAIDTSSSPNTNECIEPKYAFDDQVQVGIRFARGPMGTRTL
jgi:hypothetical protein